MFIPDFNTKYKIIYYNKYLNENKTIIIKFTEDNIVFNNENFKNYNGFECHEIRYNKICSRFVFYIDNINYKYIALREEDDSNDNKEYWVDNIIGLYDNEDNLLFSCDESDKILFEKC